MKVLDLITDTRNTKLIHLFDLLGMALAPWNVLAGGKLRTDEEEARREESGEKGRSVFSDWRRNAQEKEMSLALETVAKDVGAKSITSGKFRVPTFFPPA
jgi:aryl-alcohol dehydrogenase-like predicted oxidoreductase